jgi:hypothetical protein
MRTTCSAAVTLTLPLQFFPMRAALVTAGRARLFEWSEPISPLGMQHWNA